MRTNRNARQSDKLRFLTKLHNEICHELRQVRKTSDELPWYHLVQRHATAFCSRRCLVEFIAPELNKAVAVKQWVPTEEEEETDEPMRTVDSWFSFEGRCLLCGERIGKHHNSGPQQHLAVSSEEGYLNDDLEQCGITRTAFLGHRLVNTRHVRALR